MNPLGYLHGDDKETIEKIFALLDGLSYQKAIGIVDCVHDMLKYKAFVRSEPLQIDVCEIQKAVREGLSHVMSQYPDASGGILIENDGNKSAATPQDKRHDFIRFSDDAYIAYDSDTNTLEIFCSGTIKIDGSHGLELQPLHSLQRRSFD